MTERIIDIIGELASALPFLLFVAFGLGRPILRKLTGSQPQPKPAAGRAAPRRDQAPIPIPGMAPMTRPARPAPAPADRQWGGAFDRTQQSRDDEALEWGSAFAKRGEDGESLKWGSAFDADREESKWGFDETEWGSSFGPDRKSEPKITVG
jgi:hypothetical protein